MMYRNAFAFLLPALLFLAACAGTGIGHDKYSNLTVVISTANVYEPVPSEKDTVVLWDTNATWTSGDTIRIDVQAADVLLFEDSHNHRFRDITGAIVTGANRYNLSNGAVGSMPLRDDPSAPCNGLLLTETGPYKLTLQVSGSDRFWEIDR